MTTLVALQETVQAVVEQFPNNEVCCAINSGNIDLPLYHAILRTIFHQTYHGPQTFALAGVNCSGRFQEAKDYLFKHAEEEHTHWRWVIEDLASTGDARPDPRTQFMSLATGNYVAFNYFVAMREPLARLSIAAVLESFGACYGKQYATALCRILKLQPNQAKFFFGHGDTDVGHTADIFEVLGRCELSPAEWSTLIEVAARAGQLYTTMCSEAARLAQSFRSA